MIEKGLLPVRDSESVAVTVKLKLPLTPGVPDMIPVAVARLKPDGNAPAVTAQVYGGFPPVALSCWLKTAPFVAPASGDVVISTGGTGGTAGSVTVNVNGFCAVCDPESDT